MPRGTLFERSHTSADLWFAWCTRECDSDWKHVPDCIVLWTIQYKAWFPEVPQSDKISEVSINEECYSSKMLWWDDPLKAQNVNRKLFRDYKIKTALPQWVLCRGTLRGPEYSFSQIENFDHREKKGFRSSIRTLQFWGTSGNPGDPNIASCKLKIIYFLNTEN